MSSCLSTVRSGCFIMLLRAGGANGVVLDLLIVYAGLVRIGL